MAIDIIGRLEKLLDDTQKYGEGYLTSKQITLSGAAVPVTETLFTVSGEVEVILEAYIDVAVTGAGLTLEAGIVSDPTALIVQTGVAALVIDTIWVNNTPSEIETRGGWKIIGNGADIIHVIRTAVATAGQITYYCRWRPLSSDGSVVAA